MTDPSVNAQPPAQYDFIGGAYDLIAGLDIYHRVCWGVSTREYRAFVDRARLACTRGWLLDAGCGSMLFSAGAHLRRDRGIAVGADASLGMLGRARRRLGNDRQPPNIVLTQADVLNNPFATGTFEVVVCLHVAHVLQDLEGLLRELRRILKPEGRLFLTSVVLVDNWRDRYLRTLVRRGIMASPRRPEEILTSLRNQFGVESHCRLLGSMLFTETGPATSGVK